jgi:hypothetical protein
MEKTSVPKRRPINTKHRIVTQETTIKQLIHLIARQKCSHPSITFSLLLETAWYILTYFIIIIIIIIMMKESVESQTGNFLCL